MYPLIYVYWKQFGSIYSAINACRYVLDEVWLSFHNVPVNTSEYRKQFGPIFSAISAAMLCMKFGWYIILRGGSGRVV